MSYSHERVKDNSKEIIKALSEEITKGSDRIIAFRNRVAFLTWIGPIVVLGSVVVAAKGNLPIRVVNVWGTVIPGIIIVVCYLGLGVVAAKIEKHAWNHVNSVRNILLSLATDDSYEWKISDYRDNINRRIVMAYSLACVLVITAAVCMTVMTFSISTHV